MKLSVLRGPLPLVNFLFLKERSPTAFRPQCGKARRVRRP